jgi:glycosyltransferase involved in cell wall biosynthesis
VKVAFYAPLLAEQLTSGDATIARMLTAALKRQDHSVERACDFRSLDLAGNAQRQQRIAVVAGWIGDRIARHNLRRPAAERPDLWLTYHLYHKAPDWLGLTVARALKIPYAIVEASFAPKQASGAWRQGHIQVRRALANADLVIGFNPSDEACVRPLMQPSAKYVTLAPFIDGAPFRAARANRHELRRHLARRHRLDQRIAWVVTVAMMREGAKLESYRLLADALGSLRDRPWQLLVVGDGPARRKVEQLMEALGRRTIMLGWLPTDAVAAVLAASDLFVWPAVKEAIGMVFLEAQAAGLPVVAADRGGVPTVVARDRTGLLIAEGDAPALAAAIGRMLSDPDQRRKMGNSGADHAMRHHDIVTAGPRLVATLEGACCVKNPS